ncbi:FAD-dependent monooxygenase [Albirhodobacter sp. R86504]|uniref:FAD-dependent monooxygenase n=1 Tax=Albirhodobacter sp. R86504 TaxID=3093848 RepID=UPI00366F069C
MIGREVTVLGAGIAGLAVARALAMRGARVTVLEQAEAIREAGAGIQISPNGVKVLAALGLGAELEAASLPSQAAELLNGETGKRVVWLPIGATGAEGGQGGADYRLVHRGKLISLLEQGAREAGVQIRLLQRVCEVDLGGEAPRVVMATGAELVTDLLIGADGLHSKARIALNGAASPFFTRQICWRATIADDTARADTARPYVAQVFMGAGRHLVSYPLQGGLRNIVAVEERNRWVEESYALRDDPMRLREAFADFCPLVQGWLAQVEAPMLWGLFRHEVAEHWGAAMPKGAVAILGDAAHPTLPFLAQGASMGLEDAWVLADLLASTEAEEAIRLYQARRKPRCARIVAAANANARNYHLSGLKRTVGHLGLRAIGAIAPRQFVKRFDWVYAHDVTGG